jgi:hypothetical protein
MPSLRNLDDNRNYGVGVLDVPAISKTANYCYFHKTRRNVNMKRAVFLIVLAVAAGAVSSVHAQERKLQRNDLPPAVRTAVDRESVGATVKGLSTEKDNGVRVYEAELMIDGRSKDLVIDALGNVLEVEEEVPMDSLPDSVRNALTNAAGEGTIGKVETLTKKGKLVAYETVVTTGKRHREIQVGPNGEKLARPQ